MCSVPRQNIEYVMHAKRRQAGKGTPARGIASASIFDRPTDVMQELGDNVCKYFINRAL